MKFKSYSHRHADIILKEKYSDGYSELLKVIAEVTEEKLIKEFLYDDNNKPRTPVVSLSPAINRVFKKEFIKMKWEVEPPIFKGDKYQKNPITNRKISPFRLDFAKDQQISVEVMFNHAGDIGHVLLKPVLASEKNHVEKEYKTEIAVLITQTTELKRMILTDNATSTYEQTIDYIQPYHNWITVPTLIIGLEPLETFKMTGPKKNRKLVTLDEKAKDITR
jgi:hypothetical protein